MRAKLFTGEGTVHGAIPGSELVMKAVGKGKVRR